MPLQRNGRPLAHIPDSGMVYADTLGRNREMYSTRPKNLCTLWYDDGVGQLRMSSNLSVEALSPFSSHVCPKQLNRIA